jgi:3'-5' exoribonuclease
MDAKINGIALHIDREQHNPSDWTSYHRLFDRYFYAPGDEVKEQHQVESSAPESENRASAAAARKDSGAAHKKTTKRNNRFQQPLRTSLGDQLAGATLDLFETREDKEHDH